MNASFPSLRKMLHAVFCIFILSLSLQVLFSCHSGKEEKVLSERVMGEVLNDLQWADAMARVKGGVSADSLRLRYRQAVFLKHHISEAEFRRSMEWYGAHADKLLAVYENMEGEKTDAQNSARKGVDAQKADSNLLWKGPDAILLTSTGQAHYSFAFVPPANDSIADRLITCSWISSWHSAEGPRQATVHLSVWLEGDSVITSRQTIYGKGDGKMFLNVPGDKKIQKITGFCYLRTAQSVRPRLLCISRLRLTCDYRSARSLAPENEGTLVRPDGADSVASDQRVPRSKLHLMRDSLHAADAMREKAPHFK
ncbi:MAG: DUF4296 domain-containing protein [Alloprevotella sp.]